MARDQRNAGWTVSSALAIVCVAILAPSARAQSPAASSISLAEAIHRAQANEPTFAASLGTQRTAGINSYLAKTALLPTATYHNQILFTQSNGTTNKGGEVGNQSQPIFIANNAIHEYTSQVSINETIGLKQLADAKVASATAARATAELEVARRGLVSSVVALYYQVSAAEKKQRLFMQALQEADAFTSLTQKREAAPEVAHADVINAQLQQQQRQRDLSDADVAADRARLELAVLLFADPRTSYATEEPGAPPTLPAQDEVNRLASAKNPEIRSALAEMRAANAGVLSARAAYLPDVVLNFNYGIDAPQFATHGRPNDVKNLGYSISGTVDLPVWDWFSTQKRVKQSEIQRDVAKVNLTAAQRRLIATLEETYREATAARDQLGLLDESVRLAAESLRLTKLRYQAGEATVLEVVDAQNTFLTAETAQADGVVRYQAAFAALGLLTGTL
jgi:outer membrane protein TolC